VIPVKGHKHLFRDERSGAIINTDTQSYLQYKKLQEQKNIQENEIQRLRDEVDELRSLISGLINKSS
tara:strand:- start:1247 stop:1447 length:201 start_codon:yes stop_codon:yes gene_type:complete